MNKTILATGVLFGFLAVLLGAFGAHGLKELLPEKELITYETGVRYQMYHALLLLILGSLNAINEKGKKWIYLFLVAGILCFSFSLYFLATAGLTGLDFKALVYMTPVGGLFLLTGWILMLYRLFRPIT